MTPSQWTWSGGPFFPQPQGHALCFQLRHCGCMHSLLSPLATPRRPGWPQIWGTAIIYYYIRLIIYPVVQWFFIRDMQPVSFDCVGCHHIYIYIYIFMITIHPFWSNSLSLRLYAKPKFGSYTPQDLYQARALLQDQAHLIVRCVLRTNDKRSLVQVTISISAPQYLLDVQSLPSLPSGIPISSDVQFWYQWQKITRFNVQPSHLIFLYEWYPQPQLCWAAKNQKGPHPETRWNLCFGEHIICISFAFHYKSPCAEFDSRQILFAHLRKMVSLLP